MTLTMQKIGPNPLVLFGDMADDDMTKAAIQFIQKNNAVGAATVRVDSNGKIECSRWAVDIKGITRIHVQEKDMRIRAVETFEEVCELIDISVIHELVHCCCTERHSDDGAKWSTFIIKAIGYPGEFIGQKSVNGMVVI